MKALLVFLIAFEMFAALLPSTQPFWALTFMNGFCILGAVICSYYLGKRCAKP